MVLGAIVPSFSGVTRAWLQTFVFIFALPHLGCAAAAPNAKFLAVFAPLTGGPAALSPDGRRVVFFQRVDARPKVVVVDLATSQTLFEVALGRESDREWIGETAYIPPSQATYLRWVDDRRIVVAIRDRQFVLIDCLERNGRPLVDLNQHTISFSTPGATTTRRGTIEGPCTGRVVALKPGAAGTLIVEARRLAGGEMYSHRLLTVDLSSGAIEAGRDIVVRGQLTYDPDGRVRGYLDRSDDREPFFLAVPQGNSFQWQKLEAMHPLAARPRARPLGSAVFSPRTIPVGVAGQQLYFASNLGRDTLGFFTLDLESGTTTYLPADDAGRDVVSLVAGHPADTLVVERASGRPVGLRKSGLQVGVHWLDPELAGVQKHLEARLRAPHVVISDWDDARDRFVVERRGRGDPGDLLLYTRADGKLATIVSARTPFADRRPATSGWTLRRGDGGTLSGWLTLPGEPVAGEKRPVVVRIESPIWAGMAPRPFDVAALASMGYAVLEVHHRGVAGLGVAHLDSARGRLDEVAAEDIVTALDGLAPAAGLDLSRVALFGTHFGAYLALRTVQLQPGRFAAAVTIEPSTDLALFARRVIGDSPYRRHAREAFQGLFGNDEARWRAQSPLTNAAAIDASVFIAANPRLYSYRWSDPLGLRRRLLKAGNVPEYVETTSGVHFHGHEQAQLWAQIETFLAARFARVTR